MPSKSNKMRDIDVNLLLLNLKEKLKLSDKEIASLSSQQDIKIPVSIFTSKLGMLESIVMYLRDDIKLPFKVIAGLVKRDYKTVWATYANAKIKIKK